MGVECLYTDEGLKLEKKIEKKCDITYTFKLGRKIPGKTASVSEGCYGRAESGGEGIAGMDGGGFSLSILSTIVFLSDVAIEPW